MKLRHSSSYRATCAVCGMANVAHKKNGFPYEAHRRSGEHVAALERQERSIAACGRARRGDSKPAIRRLAQGEKKNAAQEGDLFRQAAAAAAAKRAPRHEAGERRAVQKAAKRPGKRR